MYTLGDIARKGARIHSGSEAIVFQRYRFTYSVFEERVNRVANALASLGLCNGDRVAILAENSHRYLELYFGIAKAGLVTTPLNFRLSDAELIHILNDSEARALFFGEGYEAVAGRLRTNTPKVSTWAYMEQSTGDWLVYEDLLRQSSSQDPQVPVGENQMAFLMYTGGTTGAPKGVMLSHRNVMTAMLSMIEQYQFTSSDATCMLLPLFHASFWPAFCHLWVGGKVVVVKKPELDKILTAIETERCTHINAVPTLYNRLLDYPELDRFDLSSLRLMTYAGSPIPQTVLRRCIDKFGNILAQGYGLTEAAPVVSALMPQDHVLEGPRARQLKSVGKEMSVVAVQVVDDDGLPVKDGELGEIAVRGPNIMMGYWKNPALTRERVRDGWLHTGDIGMLDEEGYIYLVDRKADMIITGGENVYPTETENVLYQHPAVHECAVVSAPDDEWGERVQAVMVLKPGATATNEELITFCKERLAGYKCPKAVEFWKDLPKSSVGKILRNQVRSKFWNGRERNID